jgi:hypothetical protein
MHQYKIGATGQSTSAATAKTLLQYVTPATRRAMVKEVAIGFSSTTTSDQPALVELLRQTTAGTATASTPLLLDPADPAALGSGQINATAEPTAGDVLASWIVPVVGGELVYQLPLGDDIVMAVSTRIGLRVTTAQAQSNITSYIKVQE